MARRPTRRKLTPAQLSVSQSNRGKDLEDAIDLLHYGYLATGRAYPVRNHPEVRIQSRQGKKITGYVKATGAPDYTVIASGFTVVFDAKRTSKHDLILGAVEEHQARSLGAASDQGAFACLFVQTPLGRYVLPWEAIRDKYWAWKDGKYKRGTGATVVSAAELVSLSVVSFKRRTAPDYLRRLVLYLRSQQD